MSGYNFYIVATERYLPVSVWGYALYGSKQPVAQDPRRYRIVPPQRSLSCPVLRGRLAQGPPVKSRRYVIKRRHRNW